MSIFCALFNQLTNFIVLRFIDSDLVCIIGEVDVKVHGKVCAGDLIYTSNCILRRGTAVARNPKDPEIQPDGTS